MNTTQTYLDKKGRRWLRIAETRSGVYAWLRPVARANDALFDRNFKISEMLLICEVQSCH